jgi:lysophospholipase L1-like esterase
MDWYEDEVRALESELARRQERPFPAVFYGSSSIRLWAHLAEDLGDFRVLNLGFGGSTLEACAHFFERLVVPAQPSSLVVYAGDNDLGDGRSPDEVVRSFHVLLGKAMRELPAVSFGFISIKLSPARISLRDRIFETNWAIAAEIARHPACYFVDVFHPMLGQDGQPRAELFSEDGLHLSREGQKLWGQLLQPYRDKIFTPNSSAIDSGDLFSRQGESRIP